MSDHSDALREAQRLGAQAHQVAATFLLTEVNTGLALLNTINASSDRAADERRRGLALEAYDVVAERLARNGDQAVVLSDAEHDEITRALEVLRLRLERDAKRRGK
jgi:hypothetical protein